MTIGTHIAKAVKEMILGINDAVRDILFLPVIFLRLIGRVFASSYAWYAAGLSPSFVALSAHITS